MTDPKCEFAKRALTVGTLEHSLYASALSGVVAKNVNTTAREQIAAAAMDCAFGAWVFLEARATNVFKGPAA